MRGFVVVWLRLAAGLLAAAAAGVLAASAAPSRVPAPATIAYAVDFALPPDRPDRGGTTFGGLCLARLDGKGTFRLTAPADDRGPAWSPTGRVVAFARQSTTGRGHAFDVRTLDVARGTGRVLTAGLPDAGEHNLDPAFSPDGRSLAFSAGFRGRRIVVLDLASRRTRELDPDGPYTVAADPDWSPDGRLVAFTATEASGASSIRVVPAAGGESALLVADASEPAWSPDGRLLAYVTAAGRIAVSRTDGTEVRVRDNPARASGPSWSPDGRRLAFAYEVGRGGAIGLTDRDLSGWTTVVRSRHRLHEPAWRPGGGHGSRPCIRSGSARADVMRGTAHAELMVGNGGDDRLFGAGGADAIDGGPGADLVHGGPGNDFLRGGPGRDRVVGGPGDDTIEVADGQRDVVSCGPGRDRVLADRHDVVARDCERVVRR